jgi:hypothetical protein
VDHVNCFGCSVPVDVPVPAAGVWKRAPTGAALVAAPVLNDRVGVDAVVGVDREPQLKLIFFLFRSYLCNRPRPPAIRTQLTAKSANPSFDPKCAAKPSRAFIATKLNKKEK